MQTEPRPVVSYGQFIFRHRNAAFPLFFAALVIALPPQVPGGLWNVSADFGGLLVAGAGQALHVAVLGAVRIKRGGLNKNMYADRLLVDGCFAHSRNPIYLGNIMILTGLFIVYSNILAFALGTAFFVISYVAMVAAEEAFLSHEFGENYLTYCAHVPRWGPKLEGLPRTLRSMHLDWRQAMSKTYCSAYSWMSVAILLLGYKAWLAGDLTRTPAIALAVLTATFFLVRFLRKARLLDR